MTEGWHNRSTRKRTYRYCWWSWHTVCWVCPKYGSWCPLSLRPSWSHPPRPRDRSPFCCVLEKTCCPWSPSSVCQFHAASRIEKEQGASMRRLPWRHRKKRLAYNCLYWDAQDGSVGEAYVQVGLQVVEHTAGRRCLEQKVLGGERRRLVGKAPDLE